MAHAASAPSGPTIPTALEPTEPPADHPRPEDVAPASSPPPAALVELSRSDLALADPDEDLRGRRVQDVAREDLGVVEDLLVDPDQQRVRMLVVSTGGVLGIGAQRSYLPVEAVTDTTGEVVRIGQDRQYVAGAPAYDPDLTDEPPLVDRLGYYGSVYGYYGYAPFWSGRPVP